MAGPSPFSSEIDGRTLIVTPAGSVSSLAGQYFKPELDDLLEQLQGPELNNVIIDMAEVSYFGTIMLAAMNQLWRSVRQTQGRMAVCNVSTVGREILRVSGFDTLWPICSSREEALDTVESQ